MCYTDEPSYDADVYYGKMDEMLNKLPKCSDCGEPIQDDEAYLIDGELICERCMDNYKVLVEEIY